MRTIQQGVLLAAVVGAVQCGGAERTSVTPSTPRSLDFAPEPDGRKEPRLALVIGNAAYAEGPLANPVNDAHLMEQTLKGLDFEVIRHDNANQRTMREALREFSDRIKGGVALFYYAGHGIEVSGANYMVPVGVKITRREDVKIEAVPVEDVLQSVRGRPSRLNVVILDACRNDPFTRSFRSGSGGLGTMDAPKGTLIAYATAPGTVAADGNGDNGTYTQALSQAMQLQGIRIEDVFAQVREQVFRETNGLQQTWEASSMWPGAFYFKGKPVAVAECPQGSALQGGKCVRTEVSVTCPAGTQWNGTQCVAAVVCPTGTRFLEGTGCVANVVQPAQPVQPPPVPQPSPVPVPPPPRPPVPAVVPTPVVSDPGASFRAANLVWQKEPAPNQMNWESAKSYCQGLTLAGGGWRLPSKDELLALYATKSSGTASFPGMDAGYYWSSSAVSGSSGYAWGVDFYNGGAGDDGVGSHHRVRCVR
jgi:hypothetical protein